MEASPLAFWIVATLVVVALAFDFMNGFHDAANSIATVVSTRVLKPYQAVLLAAFFNFVALFVFQVNVATTVGRGIVDTGIVDHYLVFGALPEVLREFASPEAQWILYGIAMIAIVFFLPQGIVPALGATNELPTRNSPTVAPTASASSAAPADREMRVIAGPRAATASSR